MTFEELYSSRDWSDANKTQLHEVSGTYLIILPNGKRYVGSTNNLYKRLETHILNLAKRTGVKWYETAAIENNLPKQVPPGKPDYCLPVHPYDKIDKNGNRIGKRASKKAIEEWKKEKAIYDKEYIKELSKWLEENPEVKLLYNDSVYHKSIYGIPWKYYLRFLKIYVCPCEDYREYESQLLRSIVDKDNWYNKKFY